MLSWWHGTNQGREPRPNKQRGCLRKASSRMGASRLPYRTNVIIENIKTFTLLGMYVVYENVKLVAWNQPRQGVQAPQAARMSPPSLLPYGCIRIQAVRQLYFSPRLQYILPTTQTTPPYIIKCQLNVNTKYWL